MSFTAQCRALLFLLALAGVVAGRAADAPAVGSAANSADRDWEAVLAAMHPESGPEGSERERFRWFFTWFKIVLPTGADFIARHQTDVRRWDAVIPIEAMFSSWNDGLSRQAPEVVAEIDAIMSPAERAQWARQLRAWVVDLKASADATESQRFTYEARPLAERLMLAGQAAPPASEQEWGTLRADVEAAIARHPTLEEAAGFVRMYVECRYGDDEAKAAERQAAWESYVNHPSRLVQEQARRAIAFLGLKGRPLGLKFTAADGREVDLAKMRGKVVLIDFWATWCGPCKEEIPKLKKVYAACHDQGFEVVGIALENAKLTPNDTPEVTAAKLEKAGKVLMDFTAANDMPWPQYFDGKFWQNEISQQYGIDSIPAMFLVDQDGKVVSTNARGELLEKEVKRLLKL